MNGSLVNSSAQDTISSTRSSTSDPADSDIVILYLHGGGYSSSSPSTYLLFLLVLAEHLNLSSLSVSIFALDYDLAPEHQYPWQQRQAVACYQWLVSLQINPAKILVMGDSAGGHLALSMLIELHEAGTVKKPGVGVMLLSPWLTMRPPQATNELTDVLSVEFLQKTAVRFVGKRRESGVEMLNSEAKWDKVLPEWLWVSAGRNEIMYDDVVRWIVDRGTDCAGESRICGEVDQNEAHVYAWLKTTDAMERKVFLQENIGEGLDRYDAVQRIGDAIVGRWRTMKNGTN